VQKCRSEEPPSLWFGSHFLASALQTVTHLQSYFVLSPRARRNVKDVKTEDGHIFISVECLSGRSLEMAGG
jgi:hypothetical protein